LLASSLLVITLNYGLVFWGAQFLPAGISGLVSFASVALWLTALGLLSRAEPVRPAVLIGLGCGVSGFALLIVPKLGESPQQVLGIAAMFAAGLAHSQGSLWVKPVLKRHGALVITMIQMAVGGVVLLGLSAVLESPDITVLQGLREPRALLSLLYLVGIGSLLGFWLYNRLLTRWAPSQVALYTFVSPLVSLSLGALIYQERVAGLEVWAMLCLLAAVVVNFWGRLTPQHPPQAHQHVSSETP
jgi:drug/metabolite transporter (DMT)-like permease